MRFVCDSCRAQYMISDEKVGARGVKVRCKKCGHVIHVRRPDTEAEGAVAALKEPEAAAPPPETPTEENNIFRGVDEDEIGAAFDQALGGEGMKVTNPFQPSEDTDSTRVMDEESVKRFAEMSQGGTPTPVPPPPASAYEWFVAVNEVQTGPLHEMRVKELWDRGEIGPDSLTWRQGLPDWIPLSDVGELAALLAPRPSRPLFSPGAATPVPPSVMTVPVESAFSAGGMTRTVRSEVPVATATPENGFRPSATAALASLVKDEIDALNKPPPKEPPPPAPRSILEIPEEPVRRTGPSATAMPAVRAGGNGVPTVPTPFAYRASTSSGTAARKGNTVMLSVLALVVTALVAVVGYQTFHKLAPVVVLPPPPPPPTNPLAPPVTGPSGTTPVASAPVAPTPTTAKTPPPSPSLAKAPTPVPAVEASPPRRGTRRTGSSKGSSNGADSTLEGPAKDTIEASRPRNKADDLFDEVFGTPDGKKAAPSADKGGKKTAYVPPPPGVTDVPEKVGDGDIMSVVLANKSSMVRCVDEQKSRDPNLHGTLVMHWVIQTSGKTTNVAPVTESYKSSYFATCMTGLVRTWQFPKHRFAPGQAVDFPFKF